MMLGTEVASRVQRRLIEEVLAAGTSSDELIDQVLDRTLSPLTAADRLLASLRETTA
jgi:hypothetical protein